MQCRACHDAKWRLVNLLHLCALCGCADREHQPAVGLAQAQLTRMCLLGPQARSSAMGRWPGSGGRMTWASR